MAARDDAASPGVDIIIRSRSDPRDAKRITAMNIVPITVEELPPDYYALTSVVFAFFAIMTRFKIYSWLTFLLSLASVANQRYSTLDARTLLATISLVFLTFMTTHLTVNGRSLMNPLIPWLSN